MNDSPKATLWVVGPFPPPRHGVSAVNEAVLDKALSRGIATEKVNTAPSSLSRSPRVRFARAWRALPVVVATAFGFGPTKGDTLYASMSGGLGLIQEALLVAVARGRRCRIVLHHHSFRYLDSPYWPMQLLSYLAGPQALHVVLGQRMAPLLQRIYPSVKSVHIMNNASLVGPPLAAIAEEEQPRLRVGYLANLSRAKGIDDVFAVAERCHELDLPVDFSIAGPCEDPADEPGYRARCARLPNTEYLGPVYGDAKEAFWRKVQIFLFPTRYRNEADPLVIHEALRAGAVVIAYARGCIPDQVGAAGITIPSADAFVEPALTTLKAWTNNRDLLRALSLTASSQYLSLYNDSEAALEQLMKHVSRPH
jgi:glycosyltransferase involved in cell wall biosynthesis